MDFPPGIPSGQVWVPSFPDLARSGTNWLFCGALQRLAEVSVANVPSTNLIQNLSLFLLCNPRCVHTKQPMSQQSSGTHSHSSKGSWLTLMRTLCFLAGSGSQPVGLNTFWGQTILSWDCTYPMLCTLFTIQKAAKYSFEVATRVILWWGMGNNMRLGRFRTAALGVCQSPGDVLSSQLAAACVKLAGLKSFQEVFCPLSHHRSTGVTGKHSG